MERTLEAFLYLCLLPMKKKKIRIWTILKKINTNNNYEDMAVYAHKMNTTRVANLKLLEQILCNKTRVVNLLSAFQTLYIYIYINHFTKDLNKISKLVNF